MAESMNKLLFAGAATLAGALILSHGTAFADDNPEMTNLLRSSAKYNYQIVDDAGLKPSETAKAAKTEDSDAAEDTAPRRRKRDDDRAAKASRTEASRRAASASAPAVSTPFEETAYYPRLGAGGSLDWRLHRPQRRRRDWKPPEHRHVGPRHLRLSRPFQRRRLRLERAKFDRARRKQPDSSAAARSAIIIRSTISSSASRRISRARRPMAAASTSGAGYDASTVALGNS